MKNINDIVGEDRGSSLIGPGLLSPDDAGGLATGIVEKAAQTIAADAGQSSAPCAHVHISTFIKPVEIKVGERVLTYDREQQFCEDCETLMPVPTPGIVVDEYLALLTDEGSNARNAAGLLDLAVDGWLRNLERSVEQAEIHAAELAAR